MAEQFDAVSFFSKLGSDSGDLSATKQLAIGGAGQLANIASQGLRRQATLNTLSDIQDRRTEEDFQRAEENIERQSEIADREFAFGLEQQSFANRMQDWQEDIRKITRTKNKLDRLIKRGEQADESGQLDEQMILAQERLRR